MNPLQLALIEKCGNDNGFEYVLESDAFAVSMASALHPARVTVGVACGVYQAVFQPASATLLLELRRGYPRASGGDRFEVPNEAALAALLRRAASLARVLPNQAATDYLREVDAVLAALPAGLAGTEIERSVRQRIGQNRFREAMLGYWGGACAVTGIAITDALRASHAKPWAECAADAERLDVFNGFLLSANLDALFDRFLISFAEQGEIVIAPALPAKDLQILGITPAMKLRWITACHQPYLAYHRARLKQGC